MPNTYTALFTTTVGTATPSVTFNSIPQGYTDLVLVANATNTLSANATFIIQLNSDTGTNYSRTYLFGSGSSAVSGRETNAIGLSLLGFDNVTLGTMIVNFLNYSNTTTYKTTISRGSLTSNGTDAVVGLWRSTAAINSIYIYNTAGGRNIAVGSTFTLYGIANADIGAKATGGMITYDSTYFYHTFAASGTFTPKQSLSCDVLVVAGGGGGGNGTSKIGSGGGGAGGLLYYPSQSLSASANTITVGSGGAANAKGIDTTFGSLTSAVGGGRGATDTDATLINGGSGGGGAYGTNTAGGIATSGQGNNGGTGNGASSLALGAGGGGKSIVGGNANTATGGNAGNGGNGTLDYSSWGLATGQGQNVSGTYYFAGGGGGGVYDATGNARVAGTGGFGGGGVGGRNVGPILAGAGLANTGGGGGGRGDDNLSAGAAGGSGIVIIRYLKA